MKSWLENAVIYQIFIDRFAGYKYPKKWNEPVFLGGNIIGIIDEFAYIKQLGVNVIWISPFCKTSAYHGYHVTDYYSVDPNFGTEADLKELIELVHKNNMKIICDFVPNHCSHRHPFFIDALKDENSEYKDWFIFDKWPNDYRCFLSFRELPKINLDYQPAMDHILEAGRKWLSLGFDGFRVDHIIGLSNQNVKDLIGTLRTEYPKCVFIGEASALGIKWRELKTIRLPHKHLIWLLCHFGDHGDNMIYRNYINLMDGSLNFLVANKFEKYANAKTPSQANKVRSRVLKQLKSFQGKTLLPTFLDAHDLERFLYRCHGDKNRLKKAAKLQFSLIQPVIIYYGTEIGMSQIEPFSSRHTHADLLARQPMIWDASKQDKALLKFYKTLINKKTNTIGGKK